jgi:MoaA/NifB/PqqE/SkfB family radical SAM enzyme
MVDVLENLVMAYIDPRGKVFAHLDRLAAWQAGDRPAPVTVEWDLSNRCMAGCQFCHFAHTHVKGPWKVRPRTLPMAFEGTGDLASVGMVTRAQTEMAQVGVRAIIYSGGGEPTTNPHWVEILEFGRSCGLKQGMYTLGALLYKTTAQVLAELVEWVVVSLDAPEADTYSMERGVPQQHFNQACSAIRHLAEAQRCVVGVSFLLHEGNWFRTDEMLALSRSLGATYTLFRPAIQTSQANPSVCTVDRSWIAEAILTLRELAHEPDVEVDVDRFAEYENWRGHGYAQCYGPRLNTTITPDGRVWMCPQRRGIAGSCLGDLRTESFGDIWKRHPGHYTVDEGCRVMCRLHAVNSTLAAIHQPHQHEAFI